MQTKWSIIFDDFSLSKINSVKTRTKYASLTDVTILKYPDRKTAKIRLKISDFHRLYVFWTTYNPWYVM